MFSSMGSTMSILARSATWDFAIQWGLFALAAALKTEKFYDLAGKVSTCLTAGGDRTPSTRAGARAGHRRTNKILK